MANNSKRYNRGTHGINDHFTRMELTKDNLLKAWNPKKIKKEANKVDCKNCYIKGYQQAYNDILELVKNPKNIDF